MAKKKKEDKVIQMPGVPDYKAGTINYQNITRTVDVDTGEAYEEIVNTSGKQEKEPDFIKIYLKTLQSFNGLENISTDLLISICSLVQGYTNSGNDPLIFVSNSYNKEKIAKDLNIGLNMVTKHIQKLVASGILFPIPEKKRGIYYVNPFLIARGRWNNIKELQLHFNIISGEWKITRSFTPDSGVNNTEDEDE